MATGTSGDLLDDRNKHAQSILKHEILRQYMPLFIAMPGSTATDKRLVVLDGFAGKGRYTDGKPASAELILKAIKKLQQARRVTAFFIEKDKSSFESLIEVVNEYRAGDADVYAFRGRVDTYLDNVVSSATGVPLFLFLDPCGAGLPFERLKSILTGPRQGRRPQTEVLLNFSADLSRRTGGLLNKDNAAEAQWMDATCGGQWWRSTALDALSTSRKGTYEGVTHAVAHEYAQRLARATNSLSVVVPVRRRLHHQPIYHLVFLTRSPYGLWVFADAIGKARKVYLDHLGHLDEDDSGMLFTPADDMRWLIQREHDKAVSVIAANLHELVRGRGGRPFKLVNEARAVFGEAYGYATETSVTAALQSLVASGAVKVSKDRRLRERVVESATSL